MMTRFGTASPGRRIALLAMLLSPPAVGCAPRTPASSVDGDLSRSPTVSRTSAETTSDSVSWLHVRTDSGVILAAVARPSGVGPFPALIILHGTHGFAKEYVQLARDMASHGVLSVAACWFGGHYGAGTRYVTPLECPGAPPFVDVPGLERFRVARESLTGLVEAVRTLPDVQRDQVAIFGHSRGGGAALDFVLQHSGTVNGAILNSAGYPPEVTARASEVDVPVLLLHGTADSPAGGGSAMTNVTMARTFEAALRNAGKPVEAVYYDGSGHEAIFTSRSQYADAVQRIARFLHRLR